MTTQSIPTDPTNRWPTSPSLANIPAEVKELDQWCVYRLEEVNSKKTKVPYQLSGRRADSTEPATWTTFGKVLSAYQDRGYDGICFMLAEENGIVFIDLDGCVGDNGNVEPWAEEIVKKFSSYTEISQSGHGLHILVKARKPGTRCYTTKNPHRVEMFSHSRQCCLTGDVINGLTAIENRQDELDALYEMIFDTGNDAGTGKKNSTGRRKTHQELPDDVIIEHAMTAKNGDAFKDLWNGSTQSYNGDDSAADMALMNHLAFWTGGDAAQMERLFSRSQLGQRDKWRCREDYRRRTIEKALSGTEEFYTRPDDNARPVVPSLEAALTLVEDLPKRSKTDRGLPFEEDNVIALAVIKEGNEAAYERIITELMKCKVRTSNLEKKIELKARTITTQKRLGEEISKDIKEIALEIASNGDPLRFLLFQAQRNHVGDMNFQKVLIASIASAASSTSNGIQPGGTGDKGSGKSDACKATYLLVPDDHKIEGSLSPMALFAMQAEGLLKPGMVLFSDDVEFDSIIPIYKRVASSFQAGTKHHTLDNDRKLLTLTLPPRQVFWLTSVESVANDQAFDRQYPVSTDTSPEHKAMVAEEIRTRRARKELRMAVDEGISIAREIIADIFANGPFKVIIPQANKVEWLKAGDFRGQEQFWDLVDSLVILKWRQHETDADGWLVARDEDLEEAKELYLTHKEAHDSDLTEAEVKLVSKMVDHQPRTQKDLSVELGISQQSVSNRLTSIMAKSPVITCDWDGPRKIYQINPNINFGETYWDNLELIKMSGEKSQPSDVTTTYNPTYCPLTGVPTTMKINISSRIPLSYRLNTPSERGVVYSECLTCLHRGVDTPPPSCLCKNRPVKVVTEQKQQQAAT